MNTRQLLAEITYKTARSSGAGGQHVNKVASKVTLLFDVVHSKGLIESEKLLLRQKLSQRLTTEGVLILHCEESRSQHRNKELIRKRFLHLITSNLVAPKKRKPTKPTKASIQKRLETKKQQALKKAQRKKPNF